MVNVTRKDVQTDSRNMEYDVTFIIVVIVYKTTDGSTVGHH